MIEEKSSAVSLINDLLSAKKELISAKKIMDKKDKHIYPISNTPFKIPNTWQWVYLSDISIIQEGPGIRKHQYQDNGIQFLTVTNILEGSVDLFKSQKYISTDEYNEKYKHYTINKGDIVTACSGATWGKSAIYENEDVLMLNTSTLRLRFFNDLGNNKFLYYLTKSKYFKSNLASHSTGQQPNYGYSHYSKIPIPIPPLEEQKQIVAILDKAFIAIDKAKANIEKNVENAKELFENWTFNKINDSNWDKINWGETCDFIRGPFGGSLKKSMFIESGYAVYEQKQAIHNDYDSLRYFINEDKFNEMKRFEVKSGDLLMSCSGVTLGRISEVPEDAPQGIINQALLKLRAKPNKILNDFLVIWIRSKIFQDLIFKFAGGAAQPNVPGVKILKTIKVPCPAIKEQLEFINIHNELNNFTKNSINANLHKIESLEELKKSILQKAFAGKLINKEFAI